MFNSPHKLFQLLALGFALIGVGLLVGAALSYRSTREFLRTALPATGEVIGYERHNNSEGEISYFPVIVFTPEDGQEVEFTASTGSSTRSYKIGASIPLRYDPELPFNAMIDRPSDLWIATFVLGILGVAFSAVGSVGVWVFRARGPLFGTLNATRHAHIR